MRTIIAAALSIALAAPAFAQTGGTQTPPAQTEPGAPSGAMGGQGAGADAAQPGQPAMQGMQGQGMMEGGMMMRGHHAMMRGGMMDRGKHEAMMRMMIVLVDTDGSGDLSLEEVLAVHERMFNAADADGNGALTVEEINAMMGMGGDR